MPKLVPLQQWYCDTCGGIIERPDDGYLIWDFAREKNDTRYHRFRIIHARGKTPRNNPCDPHSGCSSALPDWLGKEGLVRSLNMIDVGPLHAPDYAGPEVQDLREFAELTRRLQLPYYEEARRYWGDAGEFFEDSNPSAIFQADMLRRFIEWCERR